MRQNLQTLQHQKGMTDSASKSMHAKNQLLYRYRRYRTQYDDIYIGPYFVDIDTMVRNRPKLDFYAK